MGRFVEALERRDDPRVRGWLPCALLVNGRGHRGIVRDLSPRGLFVQTCAALELGAGAIVAFRTPQGERFVLEAEVPNQRPVARSLASATSGGIGLRLLDPPSAYRRWLEGNSGCEG